MSGILTAGNPEAAAPKTRDFAVDNLNVGRKSNEQIEHDTTTTYKEKRDALSVPRMSQDKENWNGHKMMRRLKDLTRAPLRVGGAKG